MQREHRFWHFKLLLTVYRGLDYRPYQDAKQESPDASKVTVVAELSSLHVLLHIFVLKKRTQQIHLHKISKKNPTMTQSI